MDTGNGIDAHVTPSVLTWARERAGLDGETASARLGLFGDELYDWEAGRARPTFAQMDALGQLYQCPTALFFAPEPPAPRTYLRTPALTPEALTVGRRLLEAAPRGAFDTTDGDAVVWAPDGDGAVECRTLHGQGVDDETLAEWVAWLMTYGPALLAAHQPTADAPAAQ